DWLSVPSSAGCWIVGRLVSGATAADDVCQPTTARAARANSKRMEMRFTASKLAAATLAIVGLAEGTGHLHRRFANHVPLSPLSFLSRAADVHPDRLAVRYGTRT